MKKRLFAIAFLGFVFCTSVFANGAKEEAGADGKTTLSVMHTYTKEESATDNTRRIPRETVLTYGENNADSVILDITEIQHDGYETKMQALQAADDLPDVFVMKGSWVPNFLENGMLADVTDAVNNVAWKDQYREGLFTPVMSGDTYYGAPMQFSTTAIVYYNKELWKQIGYDSFPTTWDEVFAAVPKFKAMGIDTIAFGNSAKWQYNSSWISAIGARIAGVDWVNDIIAMNGKASFTDPEFIKILDLTKEIGQSGALNPDYAVVGNQQASAQFLQGKAATTIDGYWNVEYTASTATPEMLDKIGFAYLPTIEGGKGDQTGIAAGCGWFVGVNSKLQGEKLAKAKDLALFMSGPVLSQGMTDVGLISTCKTVPSDGVVLDKLHTEYNEFVQNATSTTPIWDANINASVIATMNDQFVELLADRTSSESAAKTIQAEYESVMSGR
jgi:ABC-type glycerol-3-phosphate transport system substrate-binding protein